MTLTDGDINGIYGVELRCFEKAWTKEMLREELLSARAVCVIEKSGDTVIGYTLGKTAADEAEIYKIAVLPENRRGGTAQKMLEQLHTLLKQRGASCCFLEVRSRNSPAVSLYEKLGYEKISVRKNYYPDDDALIYRISL